MKTSAIVPLALCVTAHAFLNNQRQSQEGESFECYTDETYHPEDMKSMAVAAASLRSRADTIQIDAYAHIILSEKLDYKPKEIIEGKFDFLNKNFKPWGYHFNLKDFEVTINATWAKDIDTAKTEKQQALRKGDYQTLNVYLVEGAGAGLCSLPASTSVQLTQDKITADGCFVPWGTATNASTLTHEVGHWMGLLHVFQGGCNDNDGCDDTLPQADASRAKLKIPGDRDSCDVGISCNGNKQNVFNFMDYSECSQEFTKCQGKRMDAAWQNQRKGRTIGN